MSQFPDPMDAGGIAPDGFVSGEPPAWPKGLGVFSIVWGSLGLICNGCGAVMLFAGPALHEWGRQQQTKGGGPDIGAFPDVFKATPLEIVGMLIAFLGAVMLLLAGIALVRRTLAGRTLHITYGVISIVGTLIQIVAAFAKAGAIRAWIAANPGDPFLKNPGATMGSTPIFALVISTLALIYPVFVLIWFLAIKNRPEHLGARAEEPLV